MPIKKETTAQYGKTESSMVGASMGAWLHCQRKERERETVFFGDKMEMEMQQALIFKTRFYLPYFPRSIGRWAKGKKVNYVVSMILTESTFRICMQGLHLAYMHAYICHLVTTCMEKTKNLEIDIVRLGLVHISSIHLSIHPYLK